MLWNTILESDRTFAGQTTPSFKIQYFVTFSDEVDRIFAGQLATNTKIKFLEITTSIPDVLTRDFNGNYYNKRSTRVPYYSMANSTPEMQNPFYILKYKKAKSTTWPAAMIATKPLEGITNCESVRIFAGQLTPSNESRYLLTQIRSGFESQHSKTINCGIIRIFAGHLSLSSNFSCAELNTNFILQIKIFAVFSFDYHYFKMIKYGTIWTSAGYSMLSTRNRNSSVNTNSNFWVTYTMLFLMEIFHCLQLPASLDELQVEEDDDSDTTMTDPLGVATPPEINSPGPQAQAPLVAGMLGPITDAAEAAGANVKKEAIDEYTELVRRQAEADAAEAKYASIRKLLEEADNERKRANAGYEAADNEPPNAPTDDKTDEDSSVPIRITINTTINVVGNQLSTKQRMGQAAPKVYPP